MFKRKPWEYSRPRGIAWEFAIGRRRVEIKFRVSRPFEIAPREPDNLARMDAYIKAWNAQNPDWKPLRFKAANLPGELGATWVPFCGEMLTPEYEGQDSDERRRNEAARRGVVVE